MDLPDDDHVLRHVPRKKLLTDDDGNVLGLLPQAFELRDNERGLSLNWIEFFGHASFDSNSKDAMEAFESLMNVRPSSRYAIGNVGAAVKVCAKYGANKAKIVHDENKRNPSHSLIIRLPHNDLTIMEALADEAFNVIEKDQS